MIVQFSAHISKWELVCKFGVIFHIFIISCLCSRFHVWNQWFFCSVITFPYTKCFVHSYTGDVVFTLSCLWLMENPGIREKMASCRPPSQPLCFMAMGSSNYANPAYGVATICHQVRCLLWGHPSLFHIATSLLIWYKMLCMRYISYRLTWMKFINMLSVYTQSGTHRRVNWWIIVVLT